MGVVYLAYDPELNRRVAIKFLLSQANNNPELGKRLLREAQAMAHVSHPNIVAVHDVGTAGDRIWIAMEFIEGQTVSQWIKDKPRSWRDILSTFMEAGRGLRAAHAASLIHRDFKPDNVMIGRDGHVRVMDFGLARMSLGPERENVSDLREFRGETALNTALTGIGAILGTPRYMAPEQWMGQPTLTQTDQFAFSVSLWEALHGESPFAGSTPAEIAIAVTEGKIRDAAARATTRRVRSWFQRIVRGASEHAPDPRLRPPVPPWLRRALLRGLATDPLRRWPDMQALLTALAHDPHVALRRRLVGVGVLLTIVVAIGAGYLSHQMQENQQAAALATRRSNCEAAGDLLGEAWDSARSAAAEKALLGTGLPYAADTWARARARIDVAAQDWKDMSIETCLSAQVHGTLAPVAFERRMACLQRQRAELDGLTLTLATADAKVAERAVEASAALPRAATCTDADSQQDLLRDPTQRGEIEALRQSLARANAQMAAGRYAEAKAEATRVAEAARSRGEPGLTAEALQQIGVCEEATGDFKGAETTFTNAYFLAEKAGHDPLRASISTQLAGVIGVRQLRTDDGLTWLRNAQAIVERVGLDGQPRVALLATEGSMRRFMGEIERSSELSMSVLALLEQFHGDDVRIARAQLAVGTNLFDRGDYKHAEQRYRRALDLFEHSLGPAHPDLAPPLNNLGTVLEKLGRTADAERAYAQAITIREASFGERHPGVGISLTNLGELYSRTGQAARAEVSFRRAAELFEALLGPDHPFLASALSGLGRALVAQGRLDEARPLHLRAQTIIERALGPDHIHVAFPQVDLASLELAADNPVAAIPLATRALALRAQGKMEERGEAALVLSRALWRADSDKPRARSLAIQAEADYAAAGPGFVREHIVAATWRRSLDSE